MGHMAHLSKREWSPYHRVGPVTDNAQAVLFNAVPLLVLAALYLAVARSLAPAFGPRRRSPGAAAIAATFPGIALAAALVGVLVLVEREPLGGHVWVSFAAILAVLVPAVVFLVAERRRDAAPALLAAEPQTLRAAELETVTRLSQTLARTDDPLTIARLLLDEVIALLRVDTAAVLVVDDDGRTARFLVAREGGTDLPWAPGHRIDLEATPSGIASAVFEAAPVTVYDADTAFAANRELVDRTGAKSIAYVPMLGTEGVPGVVVLATRETRVFSLEELDLAQGLVAEAGIALERARWAAELAAAAARERLTARIAHRMRSEADLDSVTQVAVEELGAATGASRCLIRHVEPGRRAAPLLAEWVAPGVDPLAGADALPAVAPATLDGRTLAVDDVLDASELAEAELDAFAAAGTRAALAAPIVAFGQLIGVLALHRPEPWAWTEDEIALAEAIAREAGGSIHAARLLKENERRAAEQAALLAAAQAVTSDLHFDSVIVRLVEEVRALLGADAADCWIFDGERRELVCRAVLGLPATEVGRTIAPEGAVGEAIATGKPVLRRDFAQTEQPPPSATYAVFSEVMAAPISSRGETRGVLGICALEPGRFDESDLQLLEAFARLASIALQNAEAFEESSRQALVQRGFHRIAAVLGESLSAEATLDAVAHAAADALGGAAAVVLRPAGTDLALAGAHNTPPELRDAFAGGLRSASRALLTAAQDGKVLASRDLRDDHRFEEAWRRTGERGGYRSLLAVPLEGPQNELSGLVLVFFREETAFGDDQLELGRQLAGAARAALERSELYEGERRSRALAQQLARTGRELARELDPAAVLDETVRQAQELVGADGASVRSLEGDELVVSAASGDGAGDAVGLRSPSTAWIAGDIVQSRLPRAVPDVGADDRVVAADAMLDAGYGAYLGVPIIDPDGSVHGVLAVYSRTPRAWGEDEVEALGALAATAAAARANADLYQRVALEKERSLAILANVADGIVAVDRDGHVVLWNVAAQHITGVPEREAIGRTPAQVLGRTLEAEQPTPTRSRLVSIRRGTEEVWLSLSEAVMIDPLGAVAGRIFAFRDISDERVVEQMKSDFVSTVSHELRTPLTSIYGFAETLLRSDVLFGDEERATFLRYIASESERLTAIVDRLLSVAELDTGDVQVQLVETDVGEVVAEAVRSIEESLLDDAHDFVLSLPDEPIAAEADREKLGHVLAHLLDNAVRYSPEGTTVTVAARREGDVVQVLVEDEGAGIPRAEQERIFRKFYRADGGGRMSGTGSTGLGLFIAEGLVTAMGGRMWVDSDEGRGSTFVFELPAANNVM
jgi:PAS domain S-box-containing protein